MRDYLEKNYPGVVQVQEIVVGNEVKGYYAVSANGDELYIPANVSGNQGMVSYIPGSGGSYNDAAMLRSMITDNPPNYVITIAKTCTDYNNCLEVGYNVAQGAGFNITDNVTVCFSASGFTGIGKTEEFLQNHPDVNTTIVSSEPYGYYQIENANLLRENQTPIIFVAPDSGFHISMMDTIKNYKNNGMNAYLMETDYTANAHIMTNKDVLTNGMLEYLLGYSDSFDQTRAGGYEIFCYNAETGQFENADASDLVNPNVSMVRIPDLGKMNLVDDFQIVSQNSPVCEKYASLSNLSDVNISAGSSRPISSSFSYVSSSMSQIRTKVSQSSFLSGVPNIGFRSGSGIPGCITEYINMYFDLVGSLVNSISMETESVVSYAQAIVDLDNDLANGMEEGTIYYDDSLSDYITIGLEEEKKQENPTTNPTNTQSGQTGGYTGGNTGGNSNAGGVTVAPVIDPDVMPIIGGVTRAVCKLKD